MFDLSKVKQLMESTGGSVVVVENGEIAYVILSADAYESIIGKTVSQPAKKTSDDDLIEKVNQDILRLQEEVKAEVDKDDFFEPETTELRVEDLPLA